MSSDPGNANSGSRARKFMFLRLGSSSFAVPLSSVREVLGFGQVSSLPNMPSYFAGLINLRGKIVSAVHLKKSLNYTANKDLESSTKRPCVVITEVRGRLFGAIADDVVEVASIPESDIDHGMDQISSKDVFAGIIKRKGAELAPILNLERALKLDELIRLNPGQTA